MSLQNSSVTMHIGMCGQHRRYVTKVIDIDTKLSSCVISFLSSYISSRRYRRLNILYLRGYFFIYPQNDLLYTTT